MKFGARRSTVSNDKMRSITIFFFFLKLSELTRLMRAKVFHFATGIYNANFRDVPWPGYTDISMRAHFVAFGLNVRV